ncbi:MAG TPA: SRPBCC domain-containing protein [Ktedonobacterales bacterium]|jgi:uncharacterized protein YndB with AHSA1/START domain|nr:SRPBCC domain-containing protein [Ktedonobacterales bacterium]
MTIKDVSTNAAELTLTGEFLDFTALGLFAYWTRPDLLRQWWPPQAEVEPRAGGAYHYWWPERNDHLRGVFTTFEPGQKLAFTWRWDHEPPEAPTRTVTVSFAPDTRDDERVTLTLRHEPYGETQAEQDARKGHLEGWTYFLGKLQSLSPADDWTGAYDRDEE